MKVMTWNTKFFPIDPDQYKGEENISTDSFNQIKGIVDKVRGRDALIDWDRIKKLEEVISKEKPDILCLQEVASETHAQAAAFRADKDLRYVSVMENIGFPQSIVTISRYKPVSVMTIDVFGYLSKFRYKPKESEVNNATDDPAQGDKIRNRVVMETFFNPALGADPVFSTIVNGRQAWELILENYAKDGVTREKPILVTEYEIGGKRVVVINVHTRSNLETPRLLGIGERESQDTAVKLVLNRVNYTFREIVATVIKEFVESPDNQDKGIIVCGDWNDGHRVGSEDYPGENTTTILSSVLSTPSNNVGTFTLQNTKKDYDFDRIYTNNKLTISSYKATKSTDTTINVQIYDKRKTYAPGEYVIGITKLGKKKTYKGLYIATRAAKPLVTYTIGIVVKGINSYVEVSTTSGKTVGLALHRVWSKKSRKWIYRMPRLVAEKSADGKNYEIPTNHDYNKGNRVFIKGQSGGWSEGKIGDLGTDTILLPVNSKNVKVLNTKELSGSLPSAFTQLYYAYKGGRYYYEGKRVLVKGKVYVCTTAHIGGKVSRFVGSPEQKNYWIEDNLLTELLEKGKRYMSDHGYVLANVELQ